MKQHNRIHHFLDHHPRLGFAAVLGLGALVFSGIPPLALAIPLQMMALYLLADFLSGLLHWFEDAYGNPEFPVLGKYVFKPNLEHHFFPRAMTKVSWLKSARVLIAIGALILGGAALAGVLTWQLIFVVAVGINGNEFHKWSHRTARENGRVISWLQSQGLIQTHQHHARHHTDPKESHYCAITDYLNPILDGTDFWERIERALAKTVRLHRRPDPSVKDANVIPMTAKCAACPLLGTNRPCGCRRLENAA